MIGRLRGAVAELAGGALVLDVGGVGYEVFVSRRTAEALPPAGTPATLLIHTYVRDDRIQLFGFADLLEKKTFEMLLTVSGVGVKIALAILSSLRPEECLEAILRDDCARLSAVLGVGRKTAQRLVLELKERARRELTEHPAASAAAGPGASVRNDLASALSNLGYHRSEIERVLERLPEAACQHFEGALRESLRLLGARAAGAR